MGWFVWRGPHPSDDATADFRGQGGGRVRRGWRLGRGVRGRGHGLDILTVSVTDFGRKTRTSDRPKYRQLEKPGICDTDFPSPQPPPPQPTKKKGAERKGKHRILNSVTVSSQGLLILRKQNIAFSAFWMRKLNQARCIKNTLSRMFPAAPGGIARVVPPSWDSRPFHYPKR